MPFFSSESLADRFVIPKLVFLYLTSLALVGIAIFSREDLKVFVSKLDLFCLFGAAAVFLFSQMFYLGGSWRVANYDFCAFLVLILFATWCQATHERFLSWLAFGNLISLVGVLGTAGFVFFQGSGNAVDVLFGNQNHLAEFLGISLILQFCSWRDLKERMWVPEWISWFLQAATLILCVLTFCRAVLLALIICAAVWLGRSLWNRFRQNSHTTKHIVQIVLFGLLTLIGSKFAFDYYIATNEYVFATKRSNVDLRLARWTNSLEMFKEHPLGIGPDNYEFTYLDYKTKKAIDHEPSETLLVKSPHNGFIELFVEYGILVGVFLMGALILWMSRCWRISNPLYFFIFLFLIIDAVFSFPVELPFSALTICLLLGAGMAEQPQRTIGLDLRIWARLAFFPLAAATALVTGSLVMSVWMGAKSNSAFFCSLTPSIWRNCMDTAMQDFSAGRFQEASNLLDEQLRLYPNNFIALKFRAFALNRLGRKPEACASLKRYDDLFEGRSSVRQVLIDQCSP